MMKVQLWNLSNFMNYLNSQLFWKKLFMSNYTITNKDILYRRIPKNNPYCWKDEDGLSVNIAALITPETIIKKFPNNNVAEFSASVPFSEKYNCIQKGKDASHAIIEGDTNPIAKKLAKAVTKVYPL